MTIIDGQLDIFDLLADDTGSKTAAKPRPTVLSPALYPPLTDHGLHCIWCGRDYSGGYNSFDYSSNHGRSGTHRKVAQCTAMDLTRSHAFSRIHALAARINNTAVVDPCCYTSGDLHKKHVKSPTVEQLAEHMRVDAQNAMSAWGVRQYEFRDMYRAELEKFGVEEYSYQLPFTAATGPGEYTAKFCAYCGTKRNLNEGGGGPAYGGFPPYSFNICNPCSEKYRTMRPPRELWTFKEIS